MRRGTWNVEPGTLNLYTEGDVSDAEDLYGRTKFLGEVGGEGCLTLRTSIIGRELSGASGLLEWFLANRGGAVKGFRKAIYTGFTTQALAGLLGWLIEEQPELSGVWQVSSAPIDKYDLLCKVNDALSLGIDITPDDDFVCDRSLDSTRFREATGWQPPTWEDMIQGLAEEPLDYEALRE